VLTFSSGSKPRFLSSVLEIKTSAIYYKVSFKINREFQHHGISQNGPEALQNL
jgi:hypothetical protein